MAITEDASTPVIATGTGTGTIVSASFTPPAGSLVIALCANQFGTTGPTVVVTSSEGGGAWTVGAQQAGATANFGMSHIAWRYYAASPGAITVTGTFTALTGGRFLACRVLNGARPTQTGATAVLQLATAGTNASFAITTTTIGAQVYGLVNDQDSNPTMVALNAATSLVGAIFSNGTDIAGTAAFKATAVVGTPGATTLGITLGASNKVSGAMMEVLPAIPAPTSGDGGFPGSMFAVNAPWAVTGGPQNPGNTAAAIPAPVLYEFTADAGVDAATVATSDAGSGRPPDAVTLGTGASAVYTAAGTLTGSRSAIFDVGVTSSTSFFQWNVPASATAQHYQGAWLRYPSTYGASASVMSLNAAGTAIVRVQITAADKVRILDAGGGTAYTSTVTLTPGLAYFVAVSALVLAAGQFQVRIFDQTSTLIEQSAVTAVDFSGGPVDNVRFGSIANQTSANWRPLTADQLTYRNDGWPVAVPLQPQGPFTVGSSLVGGGQTVRGVAAGATTWTAGTPDSAGLTDVIAKAVAPAPADSAGLTDTSAATVAPVYTDDSGLTDVPVVTRSLALTDDSGLTDTAGKTVAPVYTDSSGLTDTTALQRLAAPTDDTGLTDVPVMARTAVLVDDSGLTDVPVVAPTHILAQVDSSGLTDVTVFSYAPAPVDSSGLTDSDAVTVAPVYVDSSGLTDVSVVAPTHIVVTTDDSGLTDTPAAIRTEAPSDDSGLTDVTVMTRATVPTDDSGLTDVPVVAPTHIVAQTDDSGLTDTAALAHAPAFTDSAGLTDSDAVLVSQAPVDSAGLSDTSSSTRTAAPTDDTGLTDTTSIFSAKLLTPVDDSGLTDSTVMTRAQTPVDDSGLTDVPVLTRAAVIADSAGLTDVPLVVPTHAVVQTDDSGLTDTSAVARLAAPVDLAGLTDTAATTRTAVTADDSGLTDTSVVAPVHAQAIADSAGLTDSATELITHAQAIVDSAGITDFITSLRSLSTVDDSGLTDTAGVTQLSGSKPGALASGDTLAGTVQTGLAAATLTSSDRGAAGS